MTEAALLLVRKLNQARAGAGKPSGDTATAPKPIWEEILELTADVPDEDWAKLPPDLAVQHDHYIYGTPKRTIEKFDNIIKFQIITYKNINNISTRIGGGHPDAPPLARLAANNAVSSGYDGQF